jgi:phospholipase C
MMLMHAMPIADDEHGGFFDHAPPPMKNVPNPDGRNWSVRLNRACSYLRQRSPSGRCVASISRSHAPDPAFNFQRLGVRVPTLAVSPWQVAYPAFVAVQLVLILIQLSNSCRPSLHRIDKMTVVHDPSGPTPDSKFDHTSTLATVKKLFNLPNFLNKRDAWAGTNELSPRASFATLACQT